MKYKFQNGLVPSFLCRRNYETVVTLGNSIKRSTTKPRAACSTGPTPGDGDQMFKLCLLRDTISLHKMPK